jgi:hypothetical protein
MSILYFIDAAVPPSLIVLISLHFIAGYLALPGLFYNRMFFEAMMHRHCEKAFSADEAILQRSLLARIKIASFLAMTIFLFESVNGSMFKDPIYI